MCGSLSRHSSASGSYWQWRFAATGPLWQLSGLDISYAECGLPTPRGAFAIVAVNEGKPFTTKIIRVSRASSPAATAAGGDQNVSIYMNLSAPVGTTATHCTSGLQACQPGDKVCQTHNYCWNAAVDAYQYTLNRGYSSFVDALANIWRLDIATANSWSRQTNINRGSTQGRDQLPREQRPHGWNLPECQHLEPHHRHLVRQRTINPVRRRWLEWLRGTIVHRWASVAYPEQQRCILWRPGAAERNWPQS